MIEILSYDGKKPTSEEQQNSLLIDFSGRTSRILIVRRDTQLITFEVAPGSLGAAFDIVSAGVDVVDIARVHKKVEHNPIQSTLDTSSARSQ